MDAPNLDAPIPEAQKTEILVLASQHLSRLGDRFKPSMLDSVLKCLERYQPDIISVESMPSSQIEYMYSLEGKDREFVEDDWSLRFGKAVQDKLGITWMKADEKADNLLSMMKPSESMSNEKRRELILYLLARYDLPSAVLQFAYLPGNAQEEFPDSPDGIASLLRKCLRSANETFSIGVALARRLSLQNIEAIDNHGDINQTLAVADELFKHISFEDVYKTPCFERMAELTEKGVQENDLQELFLYVNSGEFLSDNVQYEWCRYFDDSIPKNLGRSLIATWEVRNLNIASHIRRCTTFHPGGKLLTIIGASHKAFLDNYLGALMDVKIAQYSDFAV